ncbi:MAG TPA: CPBP family intramembrane glutamic endopeptidase [Candidatus Rubrimentiphilum sp.]|nr:CPBP family intramembrane glutamic endopeptidase [Candidatus Rubrimentiphilum sp.]
MFFAVIVGNVAPSIQFVIAHMMDRNALLHPPAGVSLATLAGTDLAAIICLVALLPWTARTSLAGLGFRAPTARTIGIAAIGALAMIVLTNGLASLLETALHIKVPEQAVTLFLSMKTPAGKATFAFMGIVLAAIAEELVFRVFLFNAIRRYANFWLAATVSGLLFGFAHAQFGFTLAQNLILAVPLAIGGIILCAVYAKTRNAYASMITHGLFNAVSFVALFVAPQLAQ